MRFVAPLPGYTLTIFDPIEEPDPYHQGRQIRQRSGFIAQFRSGDYTHAERAYALQRFKFKGVPLEEDALTPMDPSFLIGTYDTDHVNFAPLAKEFQVTPEEMKEMVEQKLLDSIYHGSEFERFDAPKLPAPWKGYDNLRSTKRIVELVQETGSDIEDVLEYERQAKARPDVIEALEALLTPDASDETVIQA